MVVLFSPSTLYWLCMYFPNWRGHFLIQICQKILIWKSIHPIGNAKKNNEPWKEKGCHGLQTFEECEDFHKQSILHKIEIPILKFSWFQKQIAKPRILQKKKEQINSFLLLFDVFSCVFLEEIDVNKKTFRN